MLTILCASDEQIKYQLSCICVFFSSKIWHG